MSQLAGGYDMSFAAVQKHVAVLEGAGLVTKHPHGRERLVRGNPETIQRAQVAARPVRGSSGAIAVARLDAPARRGQHRSLTRPNSPEGPHHAHHLSPQGPCDALTMTVVAEFPVPVQRLWDAYADPRQLERFWGPPDLPRHGSPATTCTQAGAVRLRHDRARRRRVRAATGSSSSVEPLQSFEVRDGFADPEGAANAEMPSMRMMFASTDTDTGSQRQHHDLFNSVEDLDQLARDGHGGGHARGHGPDGRGAGRPGHVRRRACLRGADPQRHPGAGEPHHPRDGRAGLGAHITSPR